MGDEKLQIEIIGQDAEECANALSELIKDEFRIPPEKLNLNDRYTKQRNVGNKLDPAIIGAATGVISVVLAIPAAILAAIEIKDRVGKKQRFDLLIEKGKKLKKTKRISKIRFQIGTKEFEIEKATFSEISDSIG